MTPKLKAEELIAKFSTWQIINEDSGCGGYFRELGEEDAIGFAKDQVDEIIKAIDWHEFETPNKELEFWGEVKQELEKM